MYWIVSVEHKQQINSHHLSDRHRILVRSCTCAEVPLNNTTVSCLFCFPASSATEYMPCTFFLFFFTGKGSSAPCTPHRTHSTLTRHTGRGSSAPCTPHRTHSTLTRHTGRGISAPCTPHRTHSTLTRHTGRGSSAPCTPHRTHSTLTRHFCPLYKIITFLSVVNCYLVSAE